MAATHWESGGSEDVFWPFQALGASANCVGNRLAIEFGMGPKKGGQEFSGMAGFRHRPYYPGDQAECRASFRQADEGIQGQGQ